MEAMKDFCLWWFGNLPDFLLSDPIKYFIGLLLMCFILKIIFSWFSYGSGYKKH